MTLCPDLDIREFSRLLSSLLLVSLALWLGAALGTLNWLLPALWPLLLAAVFSDLGRGKECCATSSGKPTTPMQRKRVGSFPEYEGGEGLKIDNFVEEVWHVGQERCRFGKSRLSAVTSNPPFTELLKAFVV